MKICIAAFALLVSATLTTVSAYEINNHADMSEEAILRSVVNDNSPNGKLFRLGLKPFLLTATPGATAQSNALPLKAGLGPIPYCFGSVSPGHGIVTTWATVPQAPGERPNQPDWVAGLSIADMIRYGACYEDETEPSKRPFAHFYNPLNGGAGVAVVGIPVAANSLTWTLKRNNLYPTDLTGANHYTWEDARESFYDALTLNLSNAAPEYNAWSRQYRWGKTFQALGHMVHHLQDGAHAL